MPPKPSHYQQQQQRPYHQQQPSQYRQQQQQLRPYPHEQQPYHQQQPSYHQQQPAYQQQQQQQQRQPHPNHHQQPPPHHRRPAPSGRTNLASCIVATVFLVFVIIVVLIVFFTVFRPKDPEISVTSVQLPSFSISNSSVSFTFSQYASVRNPNRAVFSHYDSSLQLIYAGNQVGFMFIPAGKIAAGRTKYMAATFAVQSFPLAAPMSPVAASAAEFQPGMGPIVTGGGGGIGFGGSVPGGGGYRVGPTLEIESRLEMAGRVRVLHFFTHHARTSADCRVTIAVTDGSVLGFHC